MRKPILLITLIVLISTTAIYAQPLCAFDKKNEVLLATNPEYARLVEQNNIVIQKHIAARMAMKPGAAKPMAVVTIPVVVHVMHTGGAVGSIYNPSDGQIIGAIDYLNRVFAGTEPGMTAPIEGGGVVDMEIQFALAQRTPTCGATNGINRVDASSLPNYIANGVNATNTNGCPQLTLKDFARWNTANYYNIWIVNKIDGADGTAGTFTAGFAYFPGSSASLDGTVMLATQMKTGQKTLPHEIGHALSLYHTFEGSDDASECPSSDPALGDRVADTDPVSMNLSGGVYSFVCRTGSANNCVSSPYTINTESNFMAYTSCYTLFTNGQKLRAQAAMTLASRASLVHPTNLALVPCGTTINFSQATASQTESVTGTTAGCRMYRDYTYQLQIGNGPTAATTATLTYSGTATKGVDYDVTTNGNFSSPSDVLNFAAGSTAAQTFTIRIFDDGNVEAAETIILDFILNNGGGDAVKGTNAPTFTLTVADNDVNPVGVGTGTYSIGAISTYITAAPFDATQQRQRGQYLYKASELMAAGLTPGNISSLQLQLYSKLSTRPFANFTIKMANTVTNNLIDGGATVIGGMTTVYTSPSYATIPSWNTFTLSTPFNWTGNNLAIEICYDNITADAGNFADQVASYLDGGSPTQGNVFFQNGINCASAFSAVSGYVNGVKPIIRLGLATAGTTIETAAGSTATLPIYTPSNDYFYSNNNKLLMKLSSISAPLDCVTTSLEAGGNTWVNYAGGQRSAKVFNITPATNGATASYTVSFYFTNAELAGKNTAVLKLAKTSAATLAESNTSNTVLVTPAVTTLGSGITVFTASFTGFSRFYLVDEGVVLPIGLTVFTGKTTTDNNTVLNWTTSSEYNNLRFDVELSRDGFNFVALGSVVSQGNSSAEQRYEYLHIKPQPGTNYYRLKQTDRDGKYTYSKIISLEVADRIVKAFVYPVPAKNKITINFGSIISKAEIEIFSADMKTIKKQRIDGLSIIKNLDISHLAKGVYFIRYTNGSTTEILRFIKE